MHDSMKKDMCRDKANVLFHFREQKTGLSGDGIEHIGECSGCEIKFAERLVKS